MGSAFVRQSVALPELRVSEHGHFVAPKSVIWGALAERTCCRAIRWLRKRGRSAEKAVFSE
eukprot:scaffold834_cov244-Pinguiococcus_pyrenoidosus.AAC.4